MHVCCVIPFPCTQLSGKGCVVSFVCFLDGHVDCLRKVFLGSCCDVWWSWWRNLCMACLCFGPHSATSSLCAASKKLRLHEHQLSTWIKHMNMHESAWNDDRHFLRTPLESAFAFQWEDAKWPPQSDESCFLFVHVCCVIPFPYTQLSGNGCTVQ